jgi:hypothetical protein
VAPRVAGFINHKKENAQNTAAHRETEFGSADFISPTKPKATRQNRMERGGAADKAKGGHAARPSPLTVIAVPGCTVNGI